MTQEELVVAALIGKEDAKVELYNIVRKITYAAIHKFLWKTPDLLAEQAHDIATWIVLEKLEKFSFQSKFSTWVYVVAQNRIKMYARECKYAKNRALVEALPLDDTEATFEVEDNSLSAEERVIQQEVHRYIAQLAPCYRKAIINHYIREMTYPEAGAALGISDGCTKSYVARGLKLLRAHYLKGEAKCESAIN